MEALPHGMLTKQKDICMSPIWISEWGSGWVVHVGERVKWG